MTSFAIDQLSWPEIGRRVARDPRLILAVGAMDQHGPHLPLGANVLIADRVAHAVSQQLGILRAPTFSYGVSIGGGPSPAPRDFAARPSIEPSTNCSPSGKTMASPSSLSSRRIVTSPIGRRC